LITSPDPMTRRSGRRAKGEGEGAREEEPPAIDDNALHNALRNADILSDFRASWIRGEHSLLALAIFVELRADSSSGPRALGLGVRDCEGTVVVTSFKHDPLGGPRSHNLTYC
jgi:hypothetical protein